MKITLAHSGKQHSYQVAKALYDLDVLEKFYTSGYASTLLQKISRKLPGNPLQRRFIEGLPPQKVVANWRFEWKEHFIRQAMRNAVKARKAVYERDVHFDRFVAKQLPSSGSSHFWGFQGSCLESLKRAKDVGIKTIFELPSIYSKEISSLIEEEVKLHPRWASSFDNVYYPDEYRERLEIEPFSADHVIAASQFSRQSLVRFGMPEKRISVLPLGFTLDHIPFNPDKFSPYKDRPLKILFAGRVTGGKGIYYLLESMKRLKGKNIELHMIGNIRNAKEQLKDYENYFTYHGLMPQQQLLESYSDFDVLVLPSLLEGFGLVILEALGSGLPVITTTNTFGPEVISNEVNGRIIPIRDIHALVDSIEFFGSRSDDQLMHMRLAARKSAESFSWDCYRARLKEMLLSL